MVVSQALSPKIALLSQLAATLQSGFGLILQQRLWGIKDRQIGAVNSRQSGLFSRLAQTVLVQYLQLPCRTTFLGSRAAPR